ncbi:MAG: DUF5677 domain-containing protein [Bacillota bacterium]
MEKEIDLFEQNQFDEFINQFINNSDEQGIDKMTQENGIRKLIEKEAKKLLFESKKSLQQSNSYFNAAINSKRKETYNSLPKTFNELKSLFSKCEGINISIFKTNYKQFLIEEEIPNDKITGFILLNIHKKALSLFTESLTLSEFGFVQGASSRWRVMHEYFLVALALARNDNHELTQRYIDHESFGHYQTAEEIYKTTGHKSDDYDEIIKSYNGLKMKYKNSFGDFTKPFGWYSIIDKAAILGLNKFAKSLKLETLSGYVNSANMSSHSSIYNLFQLSNFSLNETINDLETILQNLSITLVNVTILLMDYLGRKKEKTTYMVYVHMNYMLLIIEKIAKTFFDERKMINSEKPTYEEVVNLYKKNI